MKPLTFATGSLPVYSGGNVSRTELPGRLAQSVLRTSCIGLISEAPAGYQAYAAAADSLIANTGWTGASS
jgi:hypothetical protein